MKRNIFIAVIIIVIFIVIITTAIVLNTNKKPQLPLLPSLPPAQNEQPQNQIDASNWKIYRNEEYGFEFKYPSSWIIQDDKLVSESIIYDKFNKTIDPLKSTHEHYFISLKSDAIDNNKIFIHTLAGVSKTSDSKLIPSNPVNEIKKLINDLQIKKISRDNKDCDFYMIPVVISATTGMQSNCEYIYLKSLNGLRYLAVISNGFSDDVTYVVHLMNKTNDTVISVYFPFKYNKKAAGTNNLHPSIFFETIKNYLEKQGKNPDSEVYKEIKKFDAIIASFKIKN